MSSRKPQKAVHSTDPSQSGWWLLAPAGGIVAGAAIPYFATHSAAWTTGGGVIGAAVGAAAAATPQLRDWVSMRSRRRQIADSAGVATNISEEPLESLRVHSSDRDITEFVPRDIQHQLLEHLNNGIPVLIEGPSMSGKTRLALETIHSHWPETPLWFPRDDGDIEKLLNSDQQPSPKTIILLDDIDRFLSNQSLTLGLLNQWTSSSCTIIATIMRSQYNEYGDRANEKVVGWDTINRFKKITLNPTLSKNELNAVKLTSYANQLSQIESIGLGPLLGCAEAVRATFADELEKHSWCGTLVKAAADWRRFGLGAATKKQLISFSSTYRDNSEEIADWDSVWSQAIRPIKGSVPLLKQAGENKWEVIDVIADDKTTWPLTIDTLLELGKMSLPAHQLYRMAMIIDQDAQPSPSPKHIFEEALKNSSNAASILGSYANYLGDTCHSMADVFRAQTIYEQAISAEPHNARFTKDYAIFLDVVVGDTNLAITMYEKAIILDPNDTFILVYYAELLASASDNTHRVKEVYERAITLDPSNVKNLRSYARFLHQQGDEIKSQKLYNQANSIDPKSAHQLYD